jgi:Fic-DOC domain mobile mystery protein B
MLDPSIDGQTPLDEDQKAGLLLPVVTQGELNAAEADAILKARIWAMVRTRPLPAHLIIDETWLKQFHKRMLAPVWDWAGSYRRTDVYIGVPWPQIPTAMREALDYSRFWLENRIANDMTMVEVAVRVHHKLVLVHPFPNGNGRWSRLVADLLVRSAREAPLTWGGGEDLQAAGSTRTAYVAALRAADSGDFRDLIAFATG